MNEPDSLPTLASVVFTRLTGFAGRSVVNRSDTYPLGTVLFLVPR